MVINLTKNEPAGSQLLMIDVDFTIADIPTILGQDYDRIGNFCCNKNISALYSRNSTGWVQVKLGGNDVNIDGTTLKFNEAGQIYVAQNYDEEIKELKTQIEELKSIINSLKEGE